jgi:hypothetical protein
MSRPGVLAAIFLSLWVLSVAANLGCRGQYGRSAADAKMFGPQSMRIHPTFTRTKDWTGDGRADGIEAVVELQDDFGEPTRATGRVMFEVYEYRQYHPDPRGKRSPNVWQWMLTDRRQQVAHWSRALRAYTFKIPFDPGRGTVVLAGQFDLDGGTPRLFDQIILAPERRSEPVPEPQTQPARARRNRGTTGPASQPEADDDLEPAAPDEPSPDTSTPTVPAPDAASSDAPDPATSTPAGAGPGAGTAPSRAPAPSADGAPRRPE